MNQSLLPSSNSISNQPKHFWYEMSLKAGNTNNHSHHIDTMAAVGEFGAAEQEDSAAQLDSPPSVTRWMTEEGGGAAAARAEIGFSCLRDVREMRFRRN